MSEPINQQNSVPSSSLTGRERFTIAVLCAVNMVNYMDRFAIAAVMVNIQEYFSIGNDMGGLLQTGFIVSYMCFSPIFGYLGDRYSRRILLLISVLFWTMSTITGTCAPTFPLFFCCRGLVGIGEAGFTTIAPTVISDIVEKEGRSMALALFYLGVPVGVGMGYILTAKITQLTGMWRWGLRASPCFGLICTILLLFILNPKRGAKEAASSGGQPVETTSYKEDLRYLMKNRSFVLSTSAVTCVAFITGVFGWWAPKLISLGFKLIPGNMNIEVGNIVFWGGCITVASGIFGVACGFLLSKFLRPHYQWVDPVICGVGILLSIPLLLGAILLTPFRQSETLILIFFGQVFVNLNWAISNDILMYVVIPTRRATATSVQSLTIHSLGDCFSPFLSGLLADFFATHIQFKESRLLVISDGSNSTIGDNQMFHSLQLSMLTLMIVQLVGGVLFLINAFYVIEDWERANRMSFKL